MKLNNIVATEWLQEHVSDSRIRVLDASWFMPGSGRDGYQEWKGKRIPGAVFFDFDRVIKDISSDLPHMLPSVETFASEVGKLGIKNDDWLVVYDSTGIFSAPRVWWMFKVMGHTNVAVLDGGLPAWETAGGLVESSKPDQPVPEQYTASLIKGRVTDKNEVVEAIRQRDSTIVDARPSSRFHGEVEEPREGVEKGHMPGAVNLPFTDLIENGRFKSPEDLKNLVGPLTEGGLPLKSSCGSGVTACFLAVIMEELTGETVAVYDGSWSEWGADPDLPKE